MKRILLTGATGFIGRHCLPLLLARGYEVHAVSSKGSYADLPDVRRHRVDLLDSGQASKLIAVVRPTHMLHLAWITEPSKYWTSPDNIRWAAASLTLLNEFAAHGGQRVVGAGTCAEYDWNSECCSEKLTPLLPQTLYGTCKHALQIILGALAKQTGFSAAWGRIFYVYGPHEHPDRFVPSMIRSMLQGKVARCSSPDQARDFLYVQDVADALVALMESKVAGPVNIASGQPLTLKDIAHRIAVNLKKESLLHVEASASGPQDVLVADVSRLTNEVGWRPKYSFDHGLKETISWWRKTLSEERK